MQISVYLRNPIQLIRRIRQEFFIRMNPDKPWLSRGSIQFLEDILSKKMSVLEWGSGRSTTWFAKRAGHVTSVEYDRSWFEKVGTDLASEGVENVDLKLIELEHPREEPTPAHYDPVPKYVDFISSFDEEKLDLAVVDGHYRAACVRAVAGKIKPGGYLLIDDVYRMSDQDWQVPSGWEQVHRSGFVGCETAIWQKPI